MFNLTNILLGTVFIYLFSKVINKSQDNVEAARYMQPQEMTNTLAQAGGSSIRANGPFAVRE